MEKGSTSQTDEEATDFSECDLSMSLSQNPNLKAVLDSRILSQFLSSCISPRGTRDMLRGKRKEKQDSFSCLFLSKLCV